MNMDVENSNLHGMESFFQKEEEFKSEIFAIGGLQLIHTLDKPKID